MFNTIYVKIAASCYSCQWWRRRLWTAATNGPNVHPPNDIWVWRATVELYWQGRTQ